MPTKPIPNDVREEVIRLRRDGLTLLEIAKRTGVSSGYVSQVSSDCKSKQRKDFTKSKRDAVNKSIKQKIREGKSLRQTAKEVGMSTEYVRCQSKIVLPDDPLVELAIPRPVGNQYLPFHVTTPGEWLVIADVHIPYHDTKTIELAVAEAKLRQVSGVLLNGDVLDSHEISRHDKDPSAPRYVTEVDMGKQFLGWLRSQLPRARFIYKQGNHEERLDKYIIQRAPALFDLEGVNLESLLHFKKYEIESVKDKRVVMLGKLNVIHGHEYAGGGGVNPARWTYLKARSVAMCGHFHRTSEHHARNISGKAEAAWSLGCACNLSPSYMPINDWNLGFAFVTVERDGGFHVENRRVLNGKAV